MFVTQKYKKGRVKGTIYGNIFVSLHHNTTNMMHTTRLALCIALLTMVVSHTTVHANELPDMEDNGPLVVYSDTTDTAAAIPVTEEYSAQPNAMNHDMDGHSLAISAPDFAWEMIQSWLPSWLSPLWFKRILVAVVIVITYLLIKRKRKEED